MSAENSKCFVVSAFSWVNKCIGCVRPDSWRVTGPRVSHKFVTPLLIPPVMPNADTITAPGGKPIDYYEISMKQFLPADPAGRPSATTVWGYGAVKSESKRGLLIHNAPSLTIEAIWNRPVRVKWINDLKGGKRQLPAPPAPGGPDAALDQPARRHFWTRHAPGFYGQDIYSPRRFQRS